MSAESSSRWVKIWLDNDKRKKCYRRVFELNGITADQVMLDMRTIRRLSIDKVRYKDNKSNHEEDLRICRTCQQRYIMPVPNTQYVRHYHCNLKLAKCNWIERNICAYWSHPDTALRLSAKIGVYGVLIAFALTFASFMLEHLSSLHSWSWGF